MVLRQKKKKKKKNKVDTATLILLKNKNKFEQIQFFVRVFRVFRFAKIDPQIVSVMLY